MTALGLASGERVLVVAPHPDDETLGAGGTIARMAAADVGVFVLAVTVGPLEQWGDGARSDPTVRQREFQAACQALGVAGAELAWVDAQRHLRLDQVAQLELVELIEHHSAVSLAAVLLMPAAGSFNQDHRAVTQAGFAAARPHAADAKPVPRIVLGYQQAEEAGWAMAPTARPVLVDTSAYWSHKAQALACYAPQLRSRGHPRSVERIHALDTTTGGQLGVDTAEAFVCYRWAS